MAFSWDKEKRSTLIRTISRFSRLLFQRGGSSIDVLCLAHLGQLANASGSGVILGVAAWRKRICSNSRGGVNGSLAKRMPVASVNAFAIAAATGLIGLSLIGLAPIGPTVSVVAAK